MITRVIRAARVARTVQDPTFSVRLPAELIRRVRVHAAVRNVEIRQIVREALERVVPKIEARR